MTATATITTAVRSEIVEAGETNQSISHIGLWGTIDPSTGAVSNFLTSFAVTNSPSPTVLGQALVFAANSLVMVLSIAGFSDYGDEQALRGVFLISRGMTYHTGAPGDNGTANRITGLAASSVPPGSITFTR